jgi:hypothetical protein
MGLFNNIFKNKQESKSSNVDGISLLEKHKEGLLDDKSFLSSFGKVKIFYSTPFGDHKDGGSRLFILPAKDETAYLPVFTSTERAKEFFEKAGRCAFLIMESTFTSFLETAKNVNADNIPVKLGAVIDPGYYGITVGANDLDAVINMTK